MFEELGLQRPGRFLEKGSKIGGGYRDLGSFDGEQVSMRHSNGLPGTSGVDTVLMWLEPVDWC